MNDEIRLFFMNKQYILNHIKQLLSDIENSPRWNYPDRPQKYHIVDIVKRVNSSKYMQEFREIDDYKLLVEIASQYEECINEDWMPYEILGLKLKQAKELLKEILKQYDEIKQGQFTAVIKTIYNRLKFLPN